MSLFSVVLASGTREGFYEAVSFAAAEAARGKKVLVFLRSGGLRSYILDQWQPSSVPALDAGLKKYEKIPSGDLLQELRDKGKVLLYACSAWVRMLELDSSLVASKVDSVVGLHAFLSQAEGGSVLYI